MEKKRKGSCFIAYHVVINKHGKGSVLAWRCIAANVTGSLVFIDDVIADKSRSRFLAQIQSHVAKLIRQCFKERVDNDNRPNRECFL